MRGIPEATVIILMAEERAELGGLARSTKTERRLRQGARIVLLAADVRKNHPTGPRLCRSVRIIRSIACRI
jgi:hypothetical protein